MFWEAKVISELFQLDLVVQRIYTLILESYTQSPLETFDFIYFNSAITVVHY